jgi:hypothetical protein
MWGRQTLSIVARFTSLIALLGTGAGAFAEAIHPFQSQITQTEKVAQYTQVSPVAQVFGAVPIQVPFYACFSAALALRIGEEVVDGQVRFWVRERFESGACLALPAGTGVSRLNNTVLEGRHIQTFRIEGSSATLTRPDWAMEIAPLGGQTKTQRAFSTFVPVTDRLMKFAAKHMQCLKEVTDLNARVEEHNREYVEAAKVKGQEEAVSKTVIIFNDSGISERGAKLNREVRAFRAKCGEVAILEASTDFVDLARELAGLDARRTGSA